MNFLEHDQKGEKWIDVDDCNELMYGLIDNKLPMVVITTSVEDKNNSIHKYRFLWRKYDPVKYKICGYIKTWEKSRACCDAFIVVYDRVTKQIEVILHNWFIDNGKYGDHEFIIIFNASCEITTSLNYYFAISNYINNFVIPDLIKIICEYCGLESAVAYYHNYLGDEIKDNIIMTTIPGTALHTDSITEIQQICHSMNSMNPSTSSFTQSQEFNEIITSDNSMVPPKIITPISYIASANSLSQIALIGTKIWRLYAKIDLSKDVDTTQQIF